MRLTVAHRNVLNAAVFLLVAMIGLVLTPRPATTRLWWLAALVIAIVLAAVFAPTLAEAILGPPLLWAVLLVLLVWTVRSIAWALPGMVLFQTTFQRRAAANPLAAAVATEGGAAHE